jgi:putative PIG3 family NAD(P)H quinone oxidoreductase
LALLAGGGYAEYAIAPAVQVLPIPRGWDFVEAAALPENLFTVWTNLIDRGRLATGDTLLVHGGAGGIGSTAIMVARALGARVLATAGGPEKCEAVLRFGAERAIDHRRQDFVAEVKDATGGRGVDLVLDVVGAEYVQRNLDALAVEGRLLLLSTLHGVEATFNLMTVLSKRLTITGSTLRARTPEQKGEIARALEAHAWPLLETRRISAPIDSRFPLAQASAAHARLESGAHVGKIVLEVR